MRLTIIGCGDAFGTGGRLQTSFHVATAITQFLIDCGASTLIGMRRLGLDPNDVDTVYLTHLHGDHFGGLPWLLIDAQYIGKRTRPLTVAGPKGTEARFTAAAEALYPGSTQSKRAYDLRFIEYAERQSFHRDGVTVTPFEVHHPSGATPYALRFEADGRSFAFTGDTGWVEALCDAARGTDLLISELYQYDVPLDIHLDFKTIDANFDRLGTKRILLTHMGEAMLARSGEVDPARYLVSHDGMVLDL